MRSLFIVIGDSVSGKEDADNGWCDRQHLADVLKSPGWLPSQRYSFVSPGLTLRDLVCHFEKAGIARQKFPERLELLDEMPRTAAGKIKKDILRGVAAKLVAV